MTELTVTPNVMPGAGADAAPKAAAKAEAAAPGQGLPQANKANGDAPDGLSAQDKSELERLRKIHADESKWEKRAKQNFDDAQKFRALLEAAGGDKPHEFDPQAEFTKLRKDIETERTERLRAEVARIEKVAPKYLFGSTEEEMRTSAQEYRLDVEQLINESKTKNTSSSAPASTVTSDGKITGPEQVTSREQLKKMSPQQIDKARQEGRLDQLLGKTP